jgi:hypothetical protein
VVNSDHVLSVGIDKTAPAKSMREVTVCSSYGMRTNSLQRARSTALRVGPRDVPGTQSTRQGRDADGAMGNGWSRPLKISH